MFLDLVPRVLCRIWLLSLVVYQPVCFQRRESAHQALPEKEAQEKLSRCCNADVRLGGLGDEGNRLADARIQTGF